MQKFAKIDVSGAGAHTLVAGISQRKIRVLAYVAIAADACDIKFQSNSTDLTGLLHCATQGGVASSIGQLGTGGQGTFGLFETAEGQDLKINLSAGTDVGGHLTYYLI